MAVHFQVSCYSRDVFMAEESIIDSWMKQNLLVLCSQCNSKFVLDTFIYFQKLTLKGAGKDECSLPPYWACTIALPVCMVGLDDELQTKFKLCVSASAPKPPQLVPALPPSLALCQRYSDAVAPLCWGAERLSNSVIWTLEELVASRDWCAQEFEDLGDLSLQVHEDAVRDHQGAGEPGGAQTQIYGHWRSWLPAGIGALKSLKTLEISHCRSMKTLSETAKEPGSLEELKLKSRTSLKELPAGVGLENSEALRLPTHATTPNTRDGSGVPFVLCLSGVSR